MPAFLVSSRPVVAPEAEPGAVMIYAVEAADEAAAVAAVEQAIPPGFDGVTCIGLAPASIVARHELEPRQPVAVESIE